MTARTVKSPAGESIEIIDDDEWMKANEKTSDKSMRQWNGGTKRLVLADLWNRGGIVNESGRATGVLWERMREHYGDDVTTQPTSFNGLYNDNPLAFERKTQGKRTYTIKLVALPESWYGKLLADERERAKIARAAKAEADREADRLAALQSDELVAHDSTPEPIEPEPYETNDDEFDALIRNIELDAPTEYDLAPPLELSIASQVAMSLLTTVVEIISSGSGAATDERVRKLTGDLNEISSKLSARLEENDRYRRQLRQAGDEITALRHERDGLRSRLRATEANLTAALKGDAVAAINGEIQKRVDAIMRVAPKGKDVGDAKS